MRVKSYFLARITVLLMGIWCVSLDRNPIVVFVAKIGLSPSPLERLFGVKGMFSGMTEGTFRLVHGDIAGAAASNVLTPVFATVVALCILCGYRPRIRTRQQEFAILLSVVFLSVFVNLV
ncbi:MAG TPA: DUF2752 domain-containing protein [Candidatus Hydrogenedentes bacterium]|nr:DUF2752 domain-containing protein [Candidatus Hydrogenedentota bacterium]